MQNLDIKVHAADSCEELKDLAQSRAYSSDVYGTPSLNSFDCKQKRQNDGKGCLFLLDTVDDAILAVQQSKLRWSREEALANVVATEFIDLPLADTEGTLESEMKGKSGKLTSCSAQKK